MKNILYILLLATMLISCSSDDNEQNYTSFIVKLQDTESPDLVLTNCIASYKKDNKFYKLESLGDLSVGKRSYEMVVTDNNITEIYIFTDYNAVNRLDVIFQLSKNKKNIFEIPKGVKGIGVTDKTDPTQYPQ